MSKIKLTKKLNNLNLNLINLTKNDFDEIDECNCGKNLFRYHDSSKNIYFAKCAYMKEEYDIKKKTWITSKKQPCKTFICYHGPTPIFAKIKEKEKIIISPSKITLEESLKRMFNYLFLSTHSSTHLNREPRKTFYFPTTTLFMKISHRESFQDYHDRIFSQKIIDVLQPIKVVIAKQQKKENKYILNLPRKIQEKQDISHFIDIPDNESVGTLSDNESIDTLSEKSEKSDYEDCSVVDEENEENEENEEVIIDENENDDFSDDFSDKDYD